MSKQNAKKPAGKKPGAAPRRADTAGRATRAKQVATRLALALVVVGAVILVAEARQTFDQEHGLDRFTARSCTATGCVRRDR